MNPLYRSRLIILIIYTFLCILSRTFLMETLLNHGYPKKIPDLTKKRIQAVFSLPQDRGEKHGSSHVSRCRIGGCKRPVHRGGALHAPAHLGKNHGISAVPDQKNRFFSDFVSEIQISLLLPCRKMIAKQKKERV